MKTLLLLGMIGTVWMTVKKDKPVFQDVIKAIPVKYKGNSTDYLPKQSYQQYRCEEISIDSSYPFRQISIYRPSEVNEYLSGVLQEKAQFIKDQAEVNGIDPLFFTAVIVHESDNGRSPLSRDNNNVAGIYLKKKYAVFPSVDECIKFTAKLMAGKLYRKCHTIDEIQQIYCPHHAANDPKNLNLGWTSGVIRHMKQMAKGKTTYQKIEPMNNQI